MHVEWHLAKRWWKALRAVKMCEVVTMAACRHDMKVTIDRRQVRSCSKGGRAECIGGYGSHRR